MLPTNGDVRVLLLTPYSDNATLSTVGILVVVSAEGRNSGYSYLDQCYCLMPASLACRRHLCDSCTA